jgi:hypothetical protein
MNEERLRAFLAESLALWGAEGTVERGEPPVMAVLQVDGRRICVERAPSAVPFRWLVRETRGRPCSSLLGVLAELRTLLGVAPRTAVQSTPRP